MAQPRLLAPPTSSQPATPSARPTTSTTSGSTSSGYRPPTSNSPPSGASSARRPSSSRPSKGNPFLEPRRRPSPPKPLPLISQSPLPSALLPPAPKLELLTILPKIDTLRSTLPPIPYLISINFGPGRRNTYAPNNRVNEREHAWRTTPFATWEWEGLQYMSFLGGGKGMGGPQGGPLAGMVGGGQGGPLAGTLEGRELIVSRGNWVEEVEALDPWGEEVRNSGLPPLPKKEAVRSGSGTPWGETNSNSGGSGNNTVQRKEMGEKKKVAEDGGGSGNNTAARMGERKKVSFGDYVKNKNTSTPKANAEKRPEGPKVTDDVNGVLAEKSDSTKSAETRKELAMQKPEHDLYKIKDDAFKPDLPATYKKVEAPVITNGHGQPPKTQNTSQNDGANDPANDPAKAHSQTEKEEGELADEPSIPSVIANILKAPVGALPIQTQNKERPREPEKVQNKRPLDDKKTSETSEKRQRIETKDGAGDKKTESTQQGEKKPYTGTARPHQRNISSESKPSTPLPAKVSASHPLARPKENERPRKDESADRRRDERRDGSGLGNKTTAMPRLLSPLPDHLGSTNGTPMSRNDPRDSRRERSPPRSEPMTKSDSRDSRRGDRTPPRSQPMQKSDSRDSRRDRSPKRARSRSPPRSQPMQKSVSRDSRRGNRSPRRARSRSPPRSEPMGKSDSRDSATAKETQPRKRMPWEKPPAARTTSSIAAKTTSTANKTIAAPSFSQKKGPAKESKREEVKKEPIPMPALMSFDLPPAVEADMNRRLDAGEMDDDAAKAFKKHKRNLSMMPNILNGTASTNGRDAKDRSREDTPMADAPDSSRKKTSTQALRERARKPDTPGVARKAVATKTKSRTQEKLVVKLRYKSNSDLGETIEAILKGGIVPSHELRDFSGRRGREMTARCPDASKREIKAQASKRSGPSPEEDDEDESHFKRSRGNREYPSTPQPTSSQALAPPSISKLKQGSTPDKASTPAATSTPKSENPVSPTATREKPGINPGLTDRQRELVRQARGESDRYIGLGTSLKRQRDGLIRPSPDSQGTKRVSDGDQKKANVMGVDSLIAYLVGFEAMDRAYKLEGSRNKGAHWRSLFPYLDSFRHGLKSSATDERAKVVLDIVATLVGYSGSSCLATLHNNLLEKEGPPNSRDEMVNFIKEQTANFKRREMMGDTYRKRCLEVSEKWPEMLKEGKALSWVATPGGQSHAVEEVKGRLHKIVGELCKDRGVEWESKLDF